MPAKPSAIIDTRVIYCGDNLDQLRNRMKNLNSETRKPEKNLRRSRFMASWLPNSNSLLTPERIRGFSSNRNYEYASPARTLWGETKEKRSFEDRHDSTKAYIDYMSPQCVELHRVLKKTGSFYYHYDWHASHYVKVMLDKTSDLAARLRFV